jgi:hypothetical protein
MRIRQNKLGLEPNLFLGVLLRFIVAGVITNVWTVFEGKVRVLL